MPDVARFPQHLYMQRVFSSNSRREICLYIACGAVGEKRTMPEQFYRHKDANLRKGAKMTNVTRPHDFGRYFLPRPTSPHSMTAVTGPAGGSPDFCAIKFRLPCLFLPYCGHRQNQPLLPIPACTATLFARLPTTTGCISVTSIFAAPAARWCMKY